LPAQYRVVAAFGGLTNLVSYCDATEETVHVLPAMVYPNPVDHLLTLDFQGNSYPKVNVTLFNWVGRQVLQKEWIDVQGKIEWQLDNLPVGIYMLKLEAGERSSVHKIIKSY